MTIHATPSAGLGSAAFFHSKKRSTAKPKLVIASANRNPSSPDQRFMLASSWSIIPKHLIERFVYLVSVVVPRWFVAL